MDVFKERDFIFKLNLRDNKQHSKGYNFKCNICNDHKRRGYLLIDNEKIIYHCFNCSTTTSLRKYIELYEPTLFEEYKQVEKEDYINKLKSGNLFAKKPSSYTSNVHYSPTELKNEHNLILFTLNPKFFKPATEVFEALEYCRKRKIPDEVIAKLKYCDLQGKGKHMLDKKLIFPCYYDEHRVYALQGRSITDKQFCNLFPNESFKVYNIFGVDLSKPVYIFESIIDSLVMPNSIGCLGTGLSEQVKSMIPNRVWCLDNDCSVREKKDKKGWEKSLEYATLGDSVVVWPSEVKGMKDTNDMYVKNKLPLKTIQDIIRNNTFKGMKAVAKLRFKLSQKR